METSDALLSLQNGSDIRGIAMDTEKYQTNLTDEAVQKIAYGTLQWLKQRGISTRERFKAGRPITIAIGHDSRLSADRIKKALYRGFSSYPVRLIDVGLATTPAMFMTTQHSDFKADVAIMITASHLPPEYNGLKFFTKEGGAEHTDIHHLLKFSIEKEEGSMDQHSAFEVISTDLLPVYAAELRQIIRKGIGSKEEYPLKNRHIIVDAGNGAGGFFAKEVLEALGAKITGSQFLNPDGHFPNHVPNPDNKEAMASIREAVLTHKADLGIIFDTDVDRSALVDHNGRSFNRNNLIGLIAHILLQENPGATIVTNSATSSHLESFIQQLGGQQDRYLTGYRNVINRAISLNKDGVNAVLAIETSGHAALKENQFLDDGAYLVAKLIIADCLLAKENKSLGDLIKDLKQPAETREHRFEIIQKPVFKTGNQLIAAFKDFVAALDHLTVLEDHVEGVRVNFSGPYGAGWFILRLSLHEPLLVWTIESDEKGKIERLEKAILPFFKQAVELSYS